MIAVKRSSVSIPLRIIKKDLPDQILTEAKREILGSLDYRIVIKSLHSPKTLHPLKLILARSAVKQR
jgi:hypothetical protein